MADGIVFPVSVDTQPAIEGLEKFELSAKGFGISVGAALGIAGAAVKGILVAEELEQVSRQFDALAKNAGVAGDKLKSSLERAAAGIVGTDDLLKAASRSLVDLGQNANKLPALFEIARKATAVFGGDVLQNFEDMNRAIASGNARVLKQMGLMVDVNEAQKAYARSIGVTVASLTDAGKQQALLNAVLAKAETAFRGVDPEAAKATTAIQRLGVAVKDLGESMSRVIAEKFGDAFAAAVGRASDAVRGVTDSLVANFGSGTDQIKAKVGVLSEEIGRIQQRIDFITRFPGMANNGELAERTKHIGALRTQYSDLVQTLQRLGAQQAVADGKSPSGASAGSSAGLFDPVKLAADKQRFFDVLNKANSDLLSTQLQQATSLEAAEAINGQISLQNERARLEQEAALKREFLDSNVIGEQQYQQLIAALRAKGAAEDASRAESIAASFGRIDASARAVARTINAALINGISGAFQSLGQALGKGEDAFAAFGNTILSSLGDILIAFGTMLIAVGLGLATVPVLFGLQGPAAVAAGIAATVLGGVMKGVAGAGGGASAASASTSTAGGGGAGSIGALSPTAELSDVSQEQRRATNVTVNVQGNILDRRQTGLELAEILQESFDSNGTLVQTGYA
jgi:hypothetical protein